MSALIGVVEQALLDELAPTMGELYRELAQAVLRGDRATARAFRADIVCRAQRDPADTLSRAEKAVEDRRHSCGIDDDAPEMFELEAARDAAGRLLRELENVIDVLLDEEGE